MTLRSKICLFAVKLFEDHGIKVDRAELLSLSIVSIIYMPCPEHVFEMTKVCPTTGHAMFKTWVPNGQRPKCPHGAVWANRSGSKARQLGQ